MGKHWTISEEARLKIVERMNGNTFGSGKRGSKLSAEAKEKVSAGLKAAWAEGRIAPRKPVYSPEEKRARRNEAARRRYASNSEAALEKLRRWHEANPGKKKEASQKYLDKHRDRLNHRARELRKTPEKKAYMQEYAPMHRRNNPHLYLTYRQNRRSRMLGAEGSHTETEWLAKVAEYNGCCAYCGDSMVVLNRDHAIPLARGGSNNIENILPSCGPCNSSKHTLTEEEFRRRLAGENQPLDDRWAAQLKAAQARGRATRSAQKRAREVC